MSGKVRIVLAVTLLMACGAPSSGLDGSRDAGRGEGGVDAGRPDAGHSDFDAGHADAGRADAGQLDAGLLDAGADAGECASCWSGGSCFDPPTDLNCGPAGAVCSACAPTASCTHGACVTPVCKGCVDSSGACLDFAAQTDSACGLNGAACGGCSVSTSCLNGICTGAACGPANCAGCCHPGGACITPANTVLACGAAGATCVSCPTNDQCLAGACVGCAGCYDSAGSCVQIGSQTVSACGSNGIACQACPAGQTCQGGVCAGPCSAISCGPGCCSGSVCIAWANQNDLTCGGGGAACAMCPSGYKCGATGKCE